jgi:hypothetical protein
MPSERPFTNMLESYQGRLAYMTKQIEKGFKPSAADKEEMKLLRKWVKKLEEGILGKK